MTIWAIVPVKPLRRGKSRLAGLLTEDERTSLNRFLLEHVLTTLNEVVQIEHTLVVSRDPTALALTRAMGGRTVLEGGAPQFNTAIDRATAVAMAHGAHAVLVLPADLPLIKSEDIVAILKAGASPPAAVIVPDRRNDGTNALFINPAGSLEYGYGVGSSQRHSHRAEQAGYEVSTLHIDTVSLDLDLPEDLELVGGLEGLGIKS